MVSSGPGRGRRLIHTVKNICQVSQPKDKIFSFKVFPEVAFLFLSENNKTSAVRLNKALVLWKPVRSTSWTVFPFPDKLFANAVIERPASDEVDDFYESWQNIFQRCHKSLYCPALSDDNVESFITRFAKSDLQEVHLDREWSFSAPAKFYLAKTLFIAFKMSTAFVVCKSHSESKNSLVAPARPQWGEWSCCFPSDLLQNVKRNVIYSRTYHTMWQGNCFQWFLLVQSKKQFDNLCACAMAL